MTLLQGLAGTAAKSKVPDAIWEEDLENSMVAN
jgi:hypothetical protein